MPRVIHFEMGVQDTARAAAFYHRVFGWGAYQVDGPEDYWILTTGRDGEPGFDGGLIRREDGQPRTVNSIDVESVDLYLERVVSNGGTISVPKKSIPGVGYLAYCTDTEGNIFCIFETNPSAE